MTMERDILHGRLEKMPIEQLRYIAAQFLEWHSSDGCPGSEKRQAHEHFDRLMRLAEARGEYGIVVDFLLQRDASQRREFIACAGATERVEMACLVFYMIGRPGWKTACTRIRRKLARIYTEDAQWAAFAGML